jgi:hypothetical protein
MKRISFLMLILLTCFVLAALPQAAASKYKIITFDPTGYPGGGNAPYQGTQAPAINAAGAIAGFYSDSVNVYHAFVRGPDGSFTEFDAPDAGTQSVAGFVPTPMGVLGGQGTYATAMNDAGLITGFYVDISNMLHGFLRTPDGTITEFDAPGVGHGYGLGTLPGNINAGGTIAGNYFDGYGVAHGFLLSPSWKFTVFDAVNAGKGPGQGTFTGWASCLTQTGLLTGWVIDANNVAHGWLRVPGVGVTTFDAPGAGLAAGQGTYSWSVDVGGQLTGEVMDKLGVMHGFVRDVNGGFRLFDARGAGKAAGQGTVAEGINMHGVVVGNFVNVYGVQRGYKRSWGGGIQRFSVKAAGQGAGQGTIPLTNNAAGQTTGSYFDDNFVIHGFVISWQ